MYNIKLKKYISKLDNLLGGKTVEEIAADRKHARMAKVNKKKIIGSGAYGCIISPPLKCEGDPIKPVQPNLTGLSELEKKDKISAHIQELKAYSERYTGQVSKIMETKEAEKEFNETRILSTLDPTNKYFVYPNKICKPDTTNLYKVDKTYLDAIIKCPVDILDNDRNLKLLYLNYSGKRILDSKLIPSDINNLLSGLENILEGVKLLHDNNLVHMDIKSGNILTTKKNNIIVSHIIDFGLIINIPDFFYQMYNNDYPNLYSTNYHIWPIDLKFISKDSLRLSDMNENKVNGAVKAVVVHSRSKFNSNINYLFKIGIPYKSFLYEDDVDDPIFGKRVTEMESIYDDEKTFSDLLKNIMVTLNTPDINNWKRSLPTNPNLLKSVKLVPGTPQFDLYSKILKGTDMYSIGILFMEIYAKYVGQVSTLFIDEKVGDTYMLYNFDVVNTFFTPMPSPTLLEYLNKLYYGLTIPFENFCNRCMELNYTKRIDAQDALDEFKKLIPKFTILNDPNFEELCTYRGFL
jgi:serine/threonine protein kinase